MLKRLAPIVLLLALCGAGCGPFGMGTTSAGSVPSSTRTTADKQTAPAGASSTVVTIDDTWGTYHSKSLHFAFRWPTKGGYAPKWEVKSYPENDPLIKDGCVVDGSYLSRETDGDFCHSRSIVELGANYETDYYTMKNGHQYIVIVFTKNLYQVNGCTVPSLNARACVEFKDEDYEALLNASIATFKFDE